MTSMCKFGNYYNIESYVYQELGHCCIKHATVMS